MCLARPARVPPLGPQDTLNRNPENYFAEIEQAAFDPANFVPGIGPSPDKMLQGRLFSHPDRHAPNSAGAARASRARRAGRQGPGRRLTPRPIGERNIEQSATISALWEP